MKTGAQALIMSLTFVVASFSDANAAEFLILPGSNTLAVLGQLESSDVAEFERQISKGVDEVILSSPGGSLDTAWEIGASIQMNGIATRLADDTECASACSILFLHGSERFMSSTARVGVHLPYFGGNDDQVSSVCVSLGSYLNEQLNFQGATMLPAERPDLFEFSASHILLETNDAAERLIELLEGGADFADLAMKHSVGPSGSSGGKLGWFSKGNMLPSFEEATLKLDIGKFSAEPVETQFGWHIIRLNDVRRLNPAKVQSKSLGIDCLTSAYQVGAFEFLRISELIQKAGGSWDLLRLIVTTPSTDMSWIGYEQAIQFGIVTGGTK